MHLDTSDPFQADIAFGAYQNALIDAVFRLTQPGDIVLTAGAHIGYVALALAEAVGPTGKVLAFEADPRMVELCQHNLSLNAGKAIELIPVALGSRNGEVKMLLSSTAGQSSFAIGHHQIGEAMVTMRQGDELMAELGVNKVDGMVLDVEGWETHVLAGLARTLSNHLPRWAIIECWDVALKGAGSSADQLLSQLQKLGWKTTDIENGVARKDSDVVCTSAA